MSKFEYISLIITITVVLLLPALALILRLTVRWTKAEVKLSEIAKDMHEMVEDKEKVHRELYNMIKDNRDHIDGRMRWVEENIWKNQPQARQQRRS
jgi:signal transduction histidine kinase